MRAKAGPLALVAVVVVAVGALVIGRTVLRDDPPCAALGARVEALDGFHWDNGFTSSGSEWLSVLTDGVTMADAPSRERVAVAVAADPDGYEQFRSALPDDLEPAAERQHALALDPASDRSDPAVERDARTLARHGTLTCNLV